MFKKVSVIVAVFSFFGSTLFSDPYISGFLQGQLGNQLFIIAATVSLALDNGATAVFPELVKSDQYNIPFNYRRLFSSLNVTNPSIDFKYNEPYFHYCPIPYTPNMEIRGYFQSEKYFIKHKDVILKLFAAPQEITTHLKKKYQEILNHPNSVSIHLRNYFLEDPNMFCHLTYGREYILKAITYFPEDALFVVFSNDMPWCKKALKDIPRKILFMEKNGGDFHKDFYLMSMCKHHIITNSTFSWWAAYLNSNPNKIVISPSLWFNPSAISDTQDLRPSSWIQLDAPHVKSMDKF